MNKQRLLPVLTLSFAICFSSLNSAYAATKTEAIEQKENAENELKNLNSNIENISGDKEAIESEIEEIDNELVDLLLTVEIINGDIADKNVAISEAEVLYEEARQKEEDQLNAMKRRIKFMYEKGETSYIDLLIKAQSISDLINKSDYIEKLYAFDRQLLEDYQETKEEVLILKEQLEIELAELEELQADYIEQSETLQATIDEKKAEIEDFDSQLAAAKEKAKEAQTKIKEQTELIKQIEAEEELARKKAEEEAKKRAEEARQKALEEARLKAEEQKRAEEQKKEEEQKKAEEESSQSDETNEQSENNSSSDSENTDNTNSESNETNTETTSNESEQSIGDDSGSEETAEEEPVYNNDPGDSGKGQEIANFALQYVGNPYVPGGTSLTEGCDCSGFTSAVFENFGISLPRSSYSQSLAGREVSYSSVQPGDVLYYGGHVGIYIGNGQIVHASTQATGIKVSNALYRSVITVRRFV
ncbi:MAG: C40 family peptidase [Lachnospiraceae bacterium]|nr:C40 family peptidase [Lachnospiraceae bacterium]